MSYLMGQFMRLQREQTAFERLIQEAPAMGLPRADQAGIKALLPARSDTDLRLLLEQALMPARTLLSVPPATATAVRLLSDPRSQRALSEYPLDSPKLLGAARAHGVDERILTEVAEELNREGR